MEKYKFNESVKNIVRTVSDMTNEEREILYAYLNMDKEEYIKITAVESFMDLASIDDNMVKKYGTYIKEYYKLPIDSRKKVCTIAYKYFVKHGSFDINVITTLVVHEVERLEDTVEEIDPVIDAIRESNKLLQKNPKINTSGIRYE